MTLPLCKKESLFTKEKEIFKVNGSENGLKLLSLNGCYIYAEFNAEIFTKKNQNKACLCLVPENEIPCITFFCEILFSNSKPR